MDHCVFIHTNHKQWMGALVAEYALRRSSKHNDRFDVRILRADDHPFLKAREGQSYPIDGTRRRWLYDDLQSFTPLRFMPPELMRYSGRGLVIDPDIFAVADPWELLSRDMEGKAILCRRRGGRAGQDGRHATSVMLLDCAKLTHWHCEEQFDELFDGERDYKAWVCLEFEPAESIGLLEPEWNDFDRLTPETRMVHNTRRETQPWKTGLPVDFRAREKFRLFPPKGWKKKFGRLVFGEYAFAGHYQAHPDAKQEHLFFGLLRECLEKGLIKEELVCQEMRQNHLRHDTFEVMKRTPPLAI